MSESATETRPSALPPTPSDSSASPGPAGAPAALACPVCGGSVDADPGNLLLGELLDCPECASELEVTSLDPLVLTEAPMAAEDWGE